MQGKESLWLKHIESQRSAHQTQREYCQSNDLNIHTFRFWKSKLSKPKHNGRLLRNSKNNFIPIHVKGEESKQESKTSPSFKVEIKPDMSIVITLQTHF